MPKSTYLSYMREKAKNYFKTQSSSNKLLSYRMEENRNFSNLVQNAYGPDYAIIVMGLIHRMPKSTGDSDPKSNRKILCDMSTLHNYVSSGKTQSNSK